MEEMGVNAIHGMCPKSLTPQVDRMLWRCFIWTIHWNQAVVVDSPILVHTTNPLTGLPKPCQVL